MLKIYTLTWNGKGKLEKLYPSLISNLKNIDYEWYIKSNGCTDETKDLKEIWNNDKVHIINYEHNKDNFSKGCNYLHSISNSKENDLVLLLNNDVIFNDSVSLSNMINLITKDNEIGIVGAKLKYTDTDIIQHAGVVMANNKYPIHHGARSKEDKNSFLNKEFQAVTGAVMLTRAKDFYLDEKYNWCFEDIDYCLDIKYNKNKKVICCGATNIFHEESATLKKNPINKLFLPLNLSYFATKWHAKIPVDYDIYARNPKHMIYNK